MKKIKIPSEDRIFNVESRGIGPLNPSVDHRLPHQRWPLKLHIDNIIKNTDKKKIREKISDFQSHNLQSVVDLPPVYHINRSCQ